jgi:hypothetical protein
MTRREAIKTVALTTGALTVIPSLIQGQDAGLSRSSKTPGYIEKLRREGRWPVRRKGWNRDGSTTTPYLVVPASPSDLGDRPLAPYLGFNSVSIELLDNSSSAVVVPASGGAYTLRFRVANEGTAGCYAGVAEFRVALPSDLDAWVASPGPHRALGYTGFVVTPGGSVTIKCPAPWIPNTPTEATSGILVQVYDLLLDPMLQPFDAGNDRHIGRRDFGAMIVNKKSGKCIDVPGLNLNATWVQQYTLNGGTNQRWIKRRLSGSGSNTIYTLTAQHSNKCLDVFNGSRSPHAKVQQYDGHGGPDQQWTFQPTDDGYFFIVSVNSGYCLNVFNESLDDGAIVEQVPNYNSDGQKWRLQWVM